jgi:hypothetical protein
MADRKYVRGRMFGELEREDGKKAYHVSEVRTL